MRRTTARRLTVGAIAGLASLLAMARPAVAQASGSYQVDPTQSVVTIAVGKSGAFSFIAGHTHEVAGPIGSGTVDVDAGSLPRSRVHIAIASASLKYRAKANRRKTCPKFRRPWRATRCWGSPATRS